MCRSRKPLGPRRTSRLTHYFRIHTAAGCSRNTALRPSVGRIVSPRLAAVPIGTPRHTAGDQRLWTLKARFELVPMQHFQFAMLPAKIDDAAVHQRRKSIVPRRRSWAQPRVAAVLRLELQPLAVLFEFFLDLLESSDRDRDGFAAVGRWSTGPTLAAIDTSRNRLTRSVVIARTSGSTALVCSTVNNLAGR